MEVLNLIRKSFLVFGKKFEIFVSGNSMEPMINDGDKIEITYISSCVLGDIIVFEHDETILVHRILKIDNDETEGERTGGFGSTGN